MIRLHDVGDVARPMRKHIAAGAAAPAAGGADDAARLAPGAKTSMNTDWLRGPIRAGIATVDAGDHADAYAIEADQWRCSATTIKSANR
jgi:hypothetical protein